METVVIIGAKGMLGRALCDVFERDSAYTVHAWDREDIDITDAQALRERLTAVWPELIINAAAYNAVDACETDDAEYAAAVALNTTAPGELARISASLQATLVHYSTDYVFDGKRPTVNGRPGNECCGNRCHGCQYRGPEETIEYRMYREEDDPHPISRYGQTKYEGERAVQANASRYYIIRLSKLFGAPALSKDAKRSFFDVMRTVGEQARKEHTSVRAVDGEISCFTYAPDLAAETRAIVEDNAPRGIYHVVNSGPCTWYDAVMELYTQLGWTDITVEPVPPSEFPRPARRPSSSVLCTTKRPPLRDYREALREYLLQKS